MNNKKYQKGFGILEVLITAVLLMIITGSVIALNKVIVKNSIVSVERTQAYNLLRQEMENIISIRNDNWENKNIWDQGIENLVENFIIDNVEYSVEIQVKNIGDQFASMLSSEGDYLNNQAKQIDISVSWLNANTNYSISDEVVITNWMPQL